MGEQADFTKPEHFNSGFISSPKPKSQGELLCSLNVRGVSYIVCRDSLTITSKVISA